MSIRNKENDRVNTNKGGDMTTDDIKQWFKDHEEELVEYKEKHDLVLPYIAELAEKDRECGRRVMPPLDAYDVSSTPQYIKFNVDVDDDSIAALIYKKNMDTLKYGGVHDVTYSLYEEGYIPGQIHYIDDLGIDLGLVLPFDARMIEARNTRMYKPSDNDLAFTEKCVQSRECALRAISKLFYIKEQRILRSENYGEIRSIIDGYVGEVIELIYNRLDTRAKFNKGFFKELKKPLWDLVDRSAWKKKKEASLEGASKAHAKVARAVELAESTDAPSEFIAYEYKKLGLTVEIINDALYYAWREKEHFEYSIYKALDSIRKAS